MAGVMYQGYASYLQAYQRHSSAYCTPSPAFAFNPYDKKYRFPSEVCGVSHGAPSPLDQSASQNYPHLSPIGAGASVSSGVPSSASPDAAALTPSTTTSSGGRTVATSTTSSSGTSSAAGGNGCDSPAAAPQSTLPPTNEEREKSDEKSPVEDYTDAHYLSANCVVLSYFSGDLAAAVDQHFSRALNQAYSKGNKTSSDPCPMSERNLPPSFWNSQYNAGGYAAGAGGTLSHDSLYSDYSSFHGLAQPDPWAYNLTAAQQYSHHHRAVSDFTYMPSTSRYSHNYSSLLMGRPRLVGKADPWNPSGRLHEDVASFDPASYAHHFPPMAGLESAGSSHQDHSKDLYWI